MSEEIKDVPIDPVNFVAGVRVIDIGDLRVARGKSRRPYTSCPHRNLVFDSSERRIWCQDCERDLEAFDAFVANVENYNAASLALDRRETAVREAEAFTLISRAGKNIDKAFRSKMVPACPSCKTGLLPEMFSEGRFSCVGIDFARASQSRREKK